MYIAAVTSGNIYNRNFRTKQVRNGNIFAGNFSGISFGIRHAQNGDSTDFQKPELIIVDAKLKPENKAYRKFIKSLNKRVPDIISSNGNIYKYSQYGTTIIVKEKHKKAGSQNGIVKQISNEYNNEAKILLALPEEFNNRLKIIGYTSKSGDVETIATEYIDGEIIDAKKNKLTKNMLADLYKDLIYLDKAGILHRDLTTYNIFIDKNNKLRIIDYGAAKTFDEMEELSESGMTKYKLPDFLPYSNIDNFEENTLLVYLTQLNSLKSRDNKIAAENIFEEHLKLKAGYYSELEKIIRSGSSANKPTLIRNTEIYKNVFNLLKDDKLTENEKKDLKETELLRINMNHAQKRVRLYNSNALKNPLTAIYWNMLEGIYNKTLITKSKAYAQKYENNDVLREYFRLQAKIGMYHYKNIFKTEYDKNSRRMNELLQNDEIQLPQTLLTEGNLLKTLDADNQWCGPAIPIYKIEKN